METKDMVLTDEIKQKLKGFVAFSVNNTFKYVPKVYRENDIPKELWPIYVLKSKNGLEITKLEDDIGYVSIDNTGGDSKYMPRSGTIKLKTLREGIISVKNQLHEDGSFINFDAKTGIIIIKKQDGTESKINSSIDGFIKYLPSDIQLDLVNAINERDTLTEEELQGLQ